MRLVQYQFKNKNGEVRVVDTLEEKRAFNENGFEFDKEILVDYKLERNNDDLTDM